MNRYHLTFGSQYSHNAHPYIPNAHPDGYYVVEARSEQAARLLVAAVLGTAWSDLYPEGSVATEDSERWYPRGVLGTIRSETVPVELEVTGIHDGPV